MSRSVSCLVFLQRRLTGEYWTDYKKKRWTNKQKSNRKMYRNRGHRGHSLMALCRTVVLTEKLTNKGSIYYIEVFQDGDDN